MKLVQIQAGVQQRVEEIAARHGDWPCHKGCDDCCRSLASLPRVTRAEWRLMKAALVALPVKTADLVRQRIRESAGGERPFTCPMLDRESGACVIYEARPVACRAYGFYAERELVLGCGRIAAIAQEEPGVVWGNHETLEQRVAELGDAAELAQWLDASGN